MRIGPMGGKVGLVTGASRGIGRATAVAVASAGAKRVYLTARTWDDLESTAAEVRAAGAEGVVLAGDLTDEEFVAGIFARIEADAAGLDFVVNNAGVAVGGSIESFPVSELRRTLEINVVAPYMCMQHAIRLMVQGGRPGKILNIGSVRSHWAWAGESGVYPASKFGLRGMTEAVAREMHWRKLPISVGLISPGETNTLMTNPEGLPAPHAMDPADVAAAIVHALSAPDGVNVYDTILFPLSMRPW